MLNFLRKLLGSPSPPASRDYVLSDLELWRSIQSRASDDEHLLAAETRRWLVSMPTDVWPKHLCVRDPRAANRLASLWADPPRCNAYLDELLHGQSGEAADATRSGRAELARLASFYRKTIAGETSNPAPQGSAAARRG